MSRSFLPYGRQTIDADDIADVCDVLQSDFLTCGPAVDSFEAAFCRATGAKYTIAVNSGTAALHLAAMALGLGENDAVIVPTLTFLATANAPHYTGAEIVFADVDPDTGLITAETFKEALVRAKKQGLTVRAVFPVHLTGQAADMPAIAALAKQHNINVVEDACHALGSELHGHQVGECTWSDMACFSFHPVKTVAMGEGGAITTNNPDLAEKLYRLRSHGMTRQPGEFEHKDLAFDPQTGAPNPWYYEMPKPGYNYRISDILCALGESQLAKLPHFSQKRRDLAALYDKKLAPLAPILQPNAKQPCCNPVWHLYAVRMDFDALKTSRAVVMDNLSKQHIGTQVHYLPVHHQPYYRSRYGNIALPGAETYYSHTLSLPLFPAMEKSDVGYVANILEAICKKTG